MAGRQSEFHQGRPIPTTDPQASAITELLA
jgi:hypothetical protein